MDPTESGLFDLQVNGAGGFEVTGGPDALDRIDAIQLSHGVTRYLPTLISPDDETAEAVLPGLGRRADDPDSPVVGVHVEGPFLSPEYAGMHPTGRLRAPADGVPDWFFAPAVRLVTLAPELPGAIELIGSLTDRGIMVSLGHSAADAATARAAFDAGATLVTHLFNAMRPLGHRDPGLAGAALEDDRIGVTVIADGIHLDPAVLKLIRDAAGSRVILVTDATAAAGVPAGRYETAGVEIEADPAGAARTADGRLAGSTMTLDAAVQNWASMTGASRAEAIRAGSEAPARAVGLDGEAGA
jgi:N-acetylglucosamine-6-phosphate deacetylase